MRARLKNGASKSSNLKFNAKPSQSTSRSKICLSKIDFSACVQKKNTSSTPSKARRRTAPGDGRDLPAHRRRTNLGRSIRPSRIAAARPRTAVRVRAHRSARRVCGRLPSASNRAASPGLRRRRCSPCCHELSFFDDAVSARASYGASVRRTSDRLRCGRPGTAGCCG